jgi:hypothetical protein
VGRRRGRLRLRDALGAALPSASPHRLPGRCRTARGPRRTLRPPGSLHDAGPPSGWPRRRGGPGPLDGSPRGRLVRGEPARRAAAVDSVVPPGTATGGPGAGAPRRRSRAVGPPPAPAPPLCDPRCSSACAAGRWPRCGGGWSGRPETSRASCRVAGGRRTAAGPRGAPAAVEQLAGDPIPASALESLVLRPACRLRNPPSSTSSPRREVYGRAPEPSPGTDGWITLHLADSATSPSPHPRNWS